MIDFPYPKVGKCKLAEVYDVNPVLNITAFIIVGPTDDPLADSRSQGRGLDPLIGRDVISLSTTLSIIV